MHTTRKNGLEGEIWIYRNIQEQLNTEFDKSETRIVFWFDDKGEYEDEGDQNCSLVM